ncbi:MAG: outer membrane protein transport protein [Myxococcota bacterium]|nr:outer membrane protein transport protein [Myxococcota bacterium]
MRGIGFLCLLSLWCDAAANPLDSFGFGSRAIALGGAVTADTNSTEATYYNPAGLVHTTALKLDLGYIYVQPDLKLNGHGQDVDASRGIQAGLSLPSRIGQYRFGIALSVHLPDQHISRIRALPERQPRWVLWDNRPQRIVINSSVAIELVDDLSFGFGLTYLANTSGTLKMSGDVDFFDAEATDLLAEVDVNLAALRYVTVGIQYRPSAAWKFGLTYREDFKLELDIAVDVQGAVVIDGDPIVDAGRLQVRSISQTLYSPQQVVFGSCYSNETWRVSLDIGWIDWSKFPAPTAIVDLGLVLEPLDVEIPTPARPIKPNFTDIWVPRVGIQRSIYSGTDLNMDARMGYFFEPSPAPEQIGKTNYIDSDKHGFSFGVGADVIQTEGIIAGPLSVDLTFLWLVLASRSHRKQSPVDPVGDYIGSGHALGLSINIGSSF